MEFAEFAQGPDAALDLCLGALLIARDAYPNLVLEAERARLDALALPLATLGLAEREPREQARAIEYHLYGELAFSGKNVDYSDPRASYLNSVLDARAGLPILLALVYTEVASRIGVSAVGVGFPGHYLVGIARDAANAPELFIDPMSGRPLRRAELEDMWRRAGGTHAPLDERYLAPAGNRASLIRMLNNLRGAYALRGDFARLLVVLDRLICLDPAAWNERRDRGLVAARLGAPKAALEDLRAYLEAAPQAGDVAEVRRLVHELSGRGGGSAN